MPRRARIYLPGLPYHIVQRGNNRQACFIDPENYRFYIDLWKMLSKQYGVSVHAYCLMINHIHFLVTPADKMAISNTMKMVGSRYAKYFNKKYQRTGSLWEGRHRSSLVQQKRYLLSCYRYIELNPVRAGYVLNPGEYPWSSYACNAWGKENWIDPHEEYLQLGSKETERCSAYRELFQIELSENDIKLFRKAAFYSQPAGDEEFRRQIELQYGIKIGQMARGRPRIKK